MSIISALRLISSKLLYTQIRDVQRWTLFCSAFVDLDHDGFCNLREFLSDSNPRLNTSIPDLIADFDADSDVDGSDLALFTLETGSVDCSEISPCSSDIYPDGRVDSVDFYLFQEDFGRVIGNLQLN